MPKSTKKAICLRRTDGRTDGRDVRTDPNYRKASLLKTRRKNDRERERNIVSEREIETEGERVKKKESFSLSFTKICCLICTYFRIFIGQSVLC